jgi:hypothetical protein
MRLLSHCSPLLTFKWCVTVNEQAQLLYLAYNDYDTSEAMLSHALSVQPSHLLARMQLDVVRSLRRAAALLPYQPPSYSHPLSAAGSAPAPWHHQVWPSMLLLCVCA